MASKGEEASHIDSDDSDENTTIPTSSEQFSCDNVKDIDKGYLINDKIIIPKQNWHTILDSGRGGQHCLVCNCHLIDFLIHVNSGLHLYNLDKCSPIPAFGFSLIRMINNVYHCAICNVIFSNGNNHTIIHLTSKPHMQTYNQSYKLAEDFFKNTDNLTQSQRTYAEISKKTTWADPPDFIFQVNGRFYNIEVKNWHMMILYQESYYCMCCCRDGRICYKYDHMYSTEHNMALRKCVLIGKYNDSLTRRLSSEFNHCMQCNLTFHYIKDNHLNSKTHTNNLFKNIIKGHIMASKVNPEQEAIQRYINEVLNQTPKFQPILNYQNNNPGPHPNYYNNNTIIINQNNVIPTPNIIHYNNNIIPSFLMQGAANIMIPNIPFYNTNYNPNTAIVNPMVNVTNIPTVVDTTNNGTINPNTQPPIQQDPIITNVNPNLLLNSNDIANISPNHTFTRYSQSSDVCLSFSEIVRDITEETELTKDHFKQHSIMVDKIKKTSFTVNYKELNHDEFPIPATSYYTKTELKAKFSMINLDFYTKFNKKILNKIVNMNELGEVKYFNGELYKIGEDVYRIPEWPKIMDLDPHQTEPETVVPLIKLTPKGEVNPVIVYCSYCDVYEENFTYSALWKTKSSKQTQCTPESIRIFNKMWAHCRVCDTLVLISEIQTHLDPQNPLSNDCEI